jgi:pimeloyl-ACP methyl ester carboxylesterase
MKCALGSFRIILMDQRGTGRSTPITTNTLARCGTAEQQAKYLSFFRCEGVGEGGELK